MKRICSLLVVLALLLSFTACSKEKKVLKDASSTSSATSGAESYVSGSAEDSSDDDVVASNGASSPLGTVSSLEDFGDKLKENGFETEIKENDDGSVTIGLKPNTPEKEEETKPAVPTLPSIEDIEKEDEPEIPVETPVTSTPTQSTPTTPEKTFYTYTTNQTHTAKKNTESYLYSILTAEQKGWYRKIDAAVNNLETEVKIGADLLKNDNYNIYYLYMIDNPEHFYLSNSCGLSGYVKPSGDEYYDTLLIYYGVGTKAGEYSDGEHKLTDSLKQKILAKKAKFEAKVNEIISTIPSAAPAVEKEKLIYDKILINSVYNLEASKSHPAQGVADDWNAYGVLMNGTGVCESYDEAFQYLLRRVGIRSTGIVGVANGGGHKWCEVEIENEWYMCDITFDDPIGAAANAAYHRYFNLTGAEMSGKDGHDWSANEYDLPICNSHNYSYQNYFKK